MGSVARRARISTCVVRESTMVPETSSPPTSRYSACESRRPCIAYFRFDLAADLSVSARLIPLASESLAGEYPLWGGSPTHGHHHRSLTPLIVHLSSTRTALQQRRCDEPRQ